VLVGGEKRILDRIFRIGCVPQEMESPLEKHGTVARDYIVEFLNALGKETRAN
jgi:hypothetical protein